MILLLTFCIVIHPSLILRAFSRLFKIFILTLFDPYGISSAALCFYSVAKSQFLMIFLTILKYFVATISGKRFKFDRGAKEWELYCFQMLFRILCWFGKLHVSSHLIINGDWDAPVKLDISFQMDGCIEMMIFIIECKKKVFQNLMILLKIIQCRLN